MFNDDEMLLGFIEEAREHLSTIEPDLLALEDNPTDMDIINRLFRSVHSIKGGAGFFGLDKMSSLAHVMENLMSKARTSKLVFNREHIDSLLVGLDRLNVMVDDVANSNELNISEELRILEALINQSEGKAPEPAAKAAPKVEAKAEAKPQAPPAAEPPKPAEPKKQAAPVGAAAEEGAPHLAVSQNRRFRIPQAEVERAKSDGMNIYAVSVHLNRDIMLQGKTPFQFISDLEELGRFIDSYLDVDGDHELEDVMDDDLMFIFIFASIMEPHIVSEGLGVREDQFQLVDFSELEVSAAPAPAALPQPPAQPKAAAKPATPPASQALPRPAAPLPPKAAPAPALKAPSKDTAPAAAKKALKSDESIRVSVGKLNKLVDLAGELVLVRNQLLQASEKLAKANPGLMPIMQSLNIVTTELQEEILNTRMQPIGAVFNKFPRVIRELGSQLGKDIVLKTEGNEVELDKTVLEALSDPLTHIIRNTADHGIETPKERRDAGKPAQGELLLKAYHESGQVIIQVADDGKGIDPARISAAAYEKGLITEEEYYNLTDREKVNLIFLPGFSTADKVTSVSGRGVGMDVVRSNIEQIGGSVELNSVLGKGTSIKMTLPLTMAIVSCLIVQTGKERFAIPQINLEELLMLKPEDYSTMLGYVQEREVLKLRGNLLPLISLAEGLGIEKHRDYGYRKIIDQENKSEKGNKKKNSQTQKVEAKYYLNEQSQRGKSSEAIRILIVSVGINKVGIIVDSIVGSEEIVVKPMPEYLKHLNFFSGATILGDGTVAMILDTLGFVQTNQLFFTDRKADSFSHETSDKKTTEAQSLLIFDNGTEEQFAITIPLIQRVDEIKREQIQRVGDKEYIEYRGQQMRILHLADYLNIQRPTYEDQICNVIIPKETRIPVGIMIHKVIDTKTLHIDITEGTIHAEGILGSTLIEGKITLLLDLYALLEMGEPDSLHHVHFELEKVASSRILLVEDTPLFQTIVKEYLQSVGFQVDVKENGEEGYKALVENAYDLVLSDIEMPVMDGFGLIKKIRAEEKWRNLPVIALTSLNDDDTVDRGLKAGFNEWMVKLDKEKVLSTLNRYLS